VLDKLAFSGVRFSYGDQPILQHFDLRVGKGEFISLIGPSGIGKSTLFQLIAGLLQPQAGTITVDGTPVANRLGMVGYMPQRDALFPWRNVVDNAALPLEIQGVPKKQAQADVRAQLSRYGLADWADAYPGELSGGMRQRVSFLRALLFGTDIMLLDEPFSSLDGITRMEMQEWLMAMWQQTGSTMLMITHDIDEAILLADRVIVLTGRPIEKPVELAVSLERPRTTAFRNRTEFLTLREQVWELLRQNAATQARPMQRPGRSGGMRNG